LRVPINIFFDDFMNMNPPEADQCRDATMWLCVAVRAKPLSLDDLLGNASVLHPGRAGGMVREVRVA
jgi:hypothetical protein